MELLKSEKFKLPTLYFISNRSEIKDLPIGVPFIYADVKTKQYIIRILEYEILYQKAISTGLPFRFKDILRDNGFDDLEDFWYNETVYMEYKTEDFDDEDFDFEEECDTVGEDKELFKEFVKDSAVYVDVQKLKDLNVFPVWLNKIEDAISTNIHNFAIFNNNMYNKKLEGMYGSLDLVSPDKNLIIIDISGSIPKAVSSTCLALSKNLAETFYADLLITGSKSTLYAYEELYKLDIQTIYNENGMDNDQVWFKKLVTSEKKNYKTVIVFGDNHSPLQKWNNKFNSGTKEISRKDAKEMCQWTINKLISFHVNGVNYNAGYSDFFSPLEEERIADWCKYLDNK